MAEPINLDDLLGGSQDNADKTVVDLASSDSTEDTVSDDANDGAVVSEGSQEDSNLQNDAGVESTEYESGDSSQDNVIDESINDKTDTQIAEDSAPEYKFKDDFIKKAVEYYEKFGSLKPYLEKADANYDEVSDVELLRKKFNEENPDLSDKVKARLFEREIEKYNLESYDEDELEIGTELLKRDAGKLRQELKEEQKQFIQSIQKQEEVDPITQQELEQQKVANRKIVESGVSDVLKNNLIKINAEGGGLNYQISDSEKVVDYALDSSKFLSAFAKDGNIDWDKWTKVVAFTENPNQFMGELIKHGKSLGRKEMEASLKNVTPTMTNKDFIESNDSSSPFDNPVEFLKGMTIRK